MTNVHSSTPPGVFVAIVNQRTKGRKASRAFPGHFLSICRRQHFISLLIPSVQRNRPYVKITRKKKKRERRGCNGVSFSLALRTAGVNAHGGDSVCPGGRAGSSDTL